MWSAMVQPTIRGRTRPARRPNTANPSQVSDTRQVSDPQHVGRVETKPAVNKIGNDPDARSSDRRIRSPLIGLRGEERRGSSEGSPPTQDARPCGTARNSPRSAKVNPSSRSRRSNASCLTQLRSDNSVTPTGSATSDTFRPKRTIPTASQRNMAVDAYTLAAGSRTGVVQTRDRHRDKGVARRG
jgi:hypothetical protein